MSQEDRKRYVAAAHAVQSAVAVMLIQNPNEASPKHLRVGIDTAKVEQLALATLLIEKGIFTADEYEKAIADAMEKEVAMRSEELSRRMNANIQLM